jgi:peptide/nickel transport system substrate-binding protein
LAGAFGATIATAPAARAAAGGATIRIATTVPAAAIDPVTVADGGGLLMLQQAGEFLTISGPDLRLRPALAESWKPNQDGTVWNFKLRKSVKFHNGKTMTADDVVATIDRLADPKNSSNALSAFTGVLSKGGTKKVDDETVEFHLDAPNGNFPYYISSDNYNAIILPADYAGDFEKSFNGTGPRNTRPRSALPSCATRSTGVPRRCRRAPSSFSTPTWSRRFWRFRAIRSTSSVSCRRSRVWRC